MKTDDFDFDLPEELIARYPSDVRGHDRLLALQRVDGTYSDHLFEQLPQLLPSDTLLVFNDSKVRKARLLARNTQGVEVEFLLLEEQDPDHWLCLVSKSKRQTIGKTYIFPGDKQGSIEGIADEGLRLVHLAGITLEYLDQYGHIPLPPYMRRSDSELDEKRYQTIYAKTVGSVAAPTAGLHFTDELLQELMSKGIDLAFVTLHVGMGTFAPVRVDQLEDHKMHTESYEISAATAQKINEAKQQGKKIIAVGTTTCRTLESAWTNGYIAHGHNRTKIFIYPGYQFKVIDGLVTNFHTPRSTLLALVSALAGQSAIFAAYQHAIQQRYQFFSYGDAMLIM
jgi:S-adenosylmethionine:tRNA ribosyltransferase-isomerase